MHVFEWLCLYTCVWGTAERLGVFPRQSACLRSLLRSLLRCRPAGRPVSLCHDYVREVYVWRGCSNQLRGTACVERLQKSTEMHYMCGGAAAIN